MSDPIRRIVMLRGLMREARHWGDFPALLAHDCTPCEVLTPDLPGNGLLWQARSPLTIADMVADVRAQVAKAWGHTPGPLHLVAISMGGMAATDWASRFPSEVASLCLISSSMRPYSALTDRLRPGQWPHIARLMGERHDPAKWEATILRMTSAVVAADPERAAQRLREWAAMRATRPVSTANAWRQLWAAARFRAPNRTPRCPTLVLSGARDALVHPRCSEAIAQAWRADARVHPEAGHDVPLDAPVWTSRQIADFQGATIHALCP